MQGGLDGEGRMLCILDKNGDATVFKVSHKVFYISHHKTGAGTDGEEPLKDGKGNYEN